MYASEAEFRALLRRAQLVGLDDTGSQQLLDLTGLKSDAPRKVPRVAEFGFASSPPAGAQFVLLSLGGGGSRMVAVGGEHPNFRQANLPAGTSCLYDSSGNVIFAKAAGGITVQSKEGMITVQAADGQNIYLGGNGADGTYQPVRTMTGVALNVMAKIA